MCIVSGATTVRMFKRHRLWMCGICCLLWMYMYITNIWNDDNFCTYQKYLLQDSYWKTVQLPWTYSIVCDNLWINAIYIIYVKVTFVFEYLFWPIHDLPEVKYNRFATNSCSPAGASSCSEPHAVYLGSWVMNLIPEAAQWICNRPYR